MLYIFGGLPGAGKSTLSRYLARERQAVYLRLDTIEQTLRDGGCRVQGPEGYMVAYALAADNLRVGLSVVVDSVNPLTVTRAAWRAVAAQATAPFIEIEVVCSDATEHRHRVETRTIDITGFQLPTWDDVVQRAYEPWDTARVVIDTAGQTVEQSIAALRQALGLDASHKEKGSI